MDDGLFGSFTMKSITREASISLRDLIEAELDPYRTEAPGRVVIDGPELILPSAKAITLGLALNELATNALKYGALSTPKGAVSVRWSIEGHHLLLDWRESDGPEVRAAAIESFGSRLLKRLIERQMKGTLNRLLAAGGVTCRIEVPGIHDVELAPAA